MLNIFSCHFYSHHKQKYFAVLCSHCRISFHVENRYLFNPIVLTLILDTYKNETSYYTDIIFLILNLNENLKNLDLKFVLNRFKKLLEISLKSKTTNWIITFYLLSFVLPPSLNLMSRFQKKMRGGSRWPLPSISSLWYKSITYDTYLESPWAPH